MRDDGPTYNVLDVWRMGYTGKGVVVAVVDEGLEKNHQELKQNYVSIKLCFLHKQAFCMFWLVFVEFELSLNSRFRHCQLGILVKEL